MDEYKHGSHKIKGGGRDKEMGVDDGLYPYNWPRCPVCGDYAMDGHITCGRAECDEGKQRACQ